MATALAVARAFSAASRPSRPASIVVASTDACSAYPLPPSGPIETVRSWATVRVPPARIPLEFATAVVSVPVENEPYAVTAARGRGGNDRRAGGAASRAGGRRARAPPGRTGGGALAGGGGWPAPAP